MEHNSSPKIYTEFLPISRADMEARGWDQLDFVVVGGDAYVDHPSFGTAIISRLLEAEGYKVGVLAQPRYTDCEDFKRFGKPKYGFFIGGGNVDSMVSHYSVAKIPRAEDEYSPGGIGGARPDRSATVYTRLAKEAYPDLPVILGGLEASLRRFAHYDYWLDTVLPSIAESSGADIISFGMGEHQTVEIARRLAAGEPVEQITDVDGTCYLTDFDHLPERYVECAGFKKVASDKTAYAKACRIQMDNQDVVSGQIIVQKQSEKYLVQNIPAKPLVRGELDKISHRVYDTGFYFGQPKVCGEAVGVTQEAEYMGYVLDASGGEALVEMKNRFFVGDELETVTPKGSEKLVIEDIVIERTGEHVGVVNVPMERVRIPCGGKLQAGDMLRGPVRNRA